MTSPDAELLSLLDRTIREHRLFQPDDTIVVAISGGADSTALLNLLTRLPGYTLRLVAAHLNHCLRGVESDADQEFCRKMAARYSIPFRSKRVDVRKFASENRLNLEDAGRRARILFLDEICSEYGAGAVALAHHADDQAETILMRLLRGSGMAGLSGMAYRNDRDYVRPLLEISRSEIEQYLRRAGLSWREDASNSDTTYLRNRIRHELLPDLEKYNPAIRSSLAATASLLSDDEALLAELTEQAFTKLCRTGEGETVCSVAQLRILNPALRRRVLRRAFVQLTGSLDRVARNHILAICSMIESDRPNARLSLPQRVTILKEYDRLSFRLTAGTDQDAAPNLIITEPGYYRLPTGALTVQISEPPADFKTVPAGTAYFSLDKVPFPWQLRTFHPGDRIIPFGMSGRKKVKDIFIARKIALSERKRIPLLFCGADLIWIADLGVSELCRIDSPLDVKVQVTWHP